MSASDVDTVVYWARAVVAASFLLSAVWKLRNPAAFAAAFRASAPARLHRLAQVAARLVPTLEIMVALLILIPSRLGQVGAVAGFLLLVAFTAFLLLSRDAEAGCGCWRAFTQTEAPRIYRRLLVGRNVVLMALALVGAQSAGTFQASRLLFGLAAGMVAAFVLMEVPEIGVVATIEKRRGVPS